MKLWGLLLHYLYVLLVEWCLLPHTAQLYGSYYWDICRYTSFTLRVWTCLSNSVWRSFVCPRKETWVQNRTRKSETQNIYLKKRKIVSFFRVRYLYLIPLPRTILYSQVYNWISYIRLARVFVQFSNAAYTLQIHYRRGETSKSWNFLIVSWINWKSKVWSLYLNNSQSTIWKYILLVGCWEKPGDNL